MPGLGSTGGTGLHLVHGWAHSKGVFVMGLGLCVIIVRWFGGTGKRGRGNEVIIIDLVSRMGMSSLSSGKRHGYLESGLLYSNAHREYSQGQIASSSPALLLRALPMCSTREAPPGVRLDRGPEECRRRLAS
jgi:hypothetical protein